MKTFIFLLLIGGFNTYEADKNILFCETTPGYCFSDNIFIHTGLVADVYLIKDVPELKRILKEERPDEAIIYDLVNSCTVGYKITEIRETVKETITKEIIKDYKIEVFEDAQ